MSVRRACALLACAPVAALAHPPFTVEGERLPALLSALVLLACWLLYGVGARRRPAGGVSAGLFHGAMLIALFALFGPLDEWAETSAAMHMTQHMLMMVVIAPLWVLARPLPQYRAVLGAAGDLLWRPLLRGVRYPLRMACLHGAVLWCWHVPVLYRLALDNPWLHVFEHACFLLSAGLFWWAVLRSSRHGTPDALLALLFTLMHTGFLGALLTFADNSFYGEARSVQDQQLAGLIMWVLGGLPYMVAALWCGTRWWRRVTRAA